jgi:two-component system response regulator protein BraR/BceR
MQKIMIIEDDITISGVLGHTVEKWGFSSYCVQDFSNVIEAFIKENPQLVLLDITLPYYNGFYWCQEIRKLSKVPIIFISSNTDNMDIVMAMNMGGDDFITKPFDLSVLVAKIQAILRRTYSYQGQMKVIEYQGIILDLSGAFLMYQGEKIELTKNEFRIMETLLNHIDVIVSRNEIMEKLWDDDCYIDDNTLTVNMTRLRKKLEEYGIKNFINTKKGLGYVIGDKYEA